MNHESQIQMIDPQEERRKYEAGQFARSITVEIGTLIDPNRKETPISITRWIKRNPDGTIGNVHTISTDPVTPEEIARLQDEFRRLSPKKQENLRNEYQSWQAAQVSKEKSSRPGVIVHFIPPSPPLELSTEAQRFALVFKEEGWVRTFSWQLQHSDSNILGINAAVSIPVGDPPA